MKLAELEQVQKMTVMVTCRVCWLSRHDPAASGELTALYCKDSEVSIAEIEPRHSDVG